jgi:hypothetical protein
LRVFKIANSGGSSEPPAGEPAAIGPPPGIGIAPGAVKTTMPAPGCVVGAICSAFPALPTD